MSMKKVLRRTDSMCIPEALSLLPIRVWRLLLSATFPLLISRFDSPAKPFYTCSMHSFEPVEVRMPVSCVERERERSKR